MSILLNLESTRLSNEQLSHDFEIQFSPSLHLNEHADYEIALLSSSLWYAWYNISYMNNNHIFKYSIGGVVKTITIPNGAYELENLNDYIANFMIANNDFETLPDGTKKPYISISGNTATLRVVFTITPGSNYIADLRTGNLNELLGFEKKEIFETEEGTMDVNIENDVNTVHIHCSVCAGSYINSSQSDVIYNSTINVPPGAQMTLQPIIPVFLPLITRDIYSIRMRVTDQLGRPLNMNNEPVSYSLVIRPTLAQRGF